MAEKIMLFLSPLNTHIPMVDEPYRIPYSEDVVYGFHTNEAPVKALLKLHPEVTDIICICSQEAEELALGYFTGKINDFCENNMVNIQPIPFDTNQSVERVLLPLVLSGGGLAPGDILYLDVTGGPRDNVITTVLLSRALMYMGVMTCGMVYSSRTPYNQVIDITETLRVFDLLDGIQNFTSFGAVRQLRDFYGTRPANDDVEKLLVSMETLIDDVTLCRFENLSAHLRTFNRNMRSGRFSNDPLLKKLLPRFRETYCKGPNNKMSELELIAWCMDSDRLQTALTLYTETLPQLLIKRELVYIQGGDPQKEDIIQEKLRAGWQNQSLLLINEYVLNMNLDWDAMEWNESSSQLPLAIENLPVLLLSSENKDAQGRPFVTLSCEIPDFQAVLRDFIYLRTIRNMLCHANTTLPSKMTQLDRYLTTCSYAPDRSYPSLKRGTLGLHSEQVKDVLRCAIVRVETMIQKSK